ncbi:WD40 repeat-like protein [Oopsacas minuta]|uniref:WD40 repeat-like protein n=1 Tax=Oopsacas minuta TaxID=111878 RepID=A0AAV7K0A9_9METZ|nr:WD40 repeat-like protein [Oopsacas minuta]
MSQPMNLKRHNSPNYSSQPKRYRSGEDGIDHIEICQIAPSPDSPALTMDEVHCYKGCSDIISSISFNNSNTQYATGGINKYLMLYDFANSVALNHPEPPRAFWQVYANSKISSVIFSNDSDNLFAGCYDGIVKSFAIESRKKDPIEIASFPGKVWSIDSHVQQPGLLASASHDGTAAIIDRRIFHKMAWVVTRLKMVDSTTCVKFRKPTELCVTCADRSITLYDIRNSKKPILQFTRSRHNKAVSYVSLSGEHIISSGIDSKVCCWSEAGDCVGEYSSHKNNRNFTGLSSTSELIAVGSEDNRVYVYNKKSSVPVCNRFLYSPIPQTFVSSVTFDHTGEYLLAANSAGYITLFRLDSAQSTHPTI